MISINKYGKNIDLSKVVATNSKKSFILDNIDVNNTLLIKVPAGVMFKSSLDESNVKIEFKDEKGNIFELVLKNLSDILATNDGNEIVKIVRESSEKVLASITDLNSALEATAAGGAQGNAQSDSARNNNSENNGIGFENRSYDNARIGDNDLPSNAQGNDNALAALQRRNSAPTIEEIDAQNTNEDESILISFIVNDVNNDDLTTTVTATNGTAIITQDGQILFTPNENFNGQSQIVLSVSDGRATTTKTIDVTVNPVNDVPTVEVNSTAIVDEDGSTTITFVADDIDGDSLTSSAVATNGTVVINGNEITYSPNADFNGSDTITLTINDGTVDVIKTINVTVNPVNDAPVITAQENTVEEDTIINGTLNATDVDLPSESSLIFSTTDVINGFTLNSDGTYEFDANSYDYLTEGEKEEIKVNITVTDDQEKTAQNTLTITVIGTNDAPVAVADFNYMNIESISTNPTTGSAIKFEFITTSDNEEVSLDWIFSSNDYAPFDDFAFYQLDADALKLIASVNELNFSNNSTLESTAQTTLSLLVPTAGTHTLIIGVSDFDDTSVETYLEILDIPSSFQLVDQTGNITTNINGYSISSTGSTVLNTFINSGELLDENTSIIIDVLANDTDIDSTDLTLDSVSIQGSKGSAEIQNNQLVFNPGSDFDYLNEGETATVIIDYEISDDFGATSSSTVTITITGTNDLPTLVADTGSTLENDSVTIDVLSNDSDIDSTTLTLSSVSIKDDTGTMGNVSISGNQLVFNPGSDFDYLAEGEETTVTVSYIVTDEQGGVSTSSAVITITGTNDAPTLTSQVLSANESDLTQADETLLDSLTFDVNGRDFSFSISNSTIVSLYNSLNLETRIESLLSTALDGTSVDVTTTEVNGTITLDVSIPDYSGIVPVSQILTQENLNIVLLDHLGSAFNLPLENAVYTGQIKFDDVDNLEEVTLSLGDISLEVTTSNKYLATLFEQLSTGTPSLSYLQDLSTDIMNGTFELSDTTQTISVPATAVTLLQNSGLLTVSLDETTGEYKIFSPLFNTMKETDSINITFEYTANDTINDSAIGTTTLTITGTNDAPIAFDNSVTVEINGSENYQGVLPGSHNLNMLKNLNITTDLTALKTNIIDDIKNNIDVNVDFTAQEQADILATLKTNLLATTQDDIVTYLKGIIESSLGTASNETSILTLESALGNFVISQDLVQIKADILALYADKLTALENIQTQIETVVAVKTLDITVNTFISTFSDANDGKPDIIFDKTALQSAIANYISSEDLNIFKTELSASMTNVDSSNIELATYLYTNAITFEDFVTQQVSLSFANTQINLVAAQSDFITLINTTIFNIIESTFTNFPDGEVLENSIKDAISTFTNQYYLATNDTDKTSAVDVFEASMKNLLIVSPLGAGSTTLINELTTLQNAVSINDLQSIDQNEILASLQNSIIVDSTILTTLQSSVITELKTYISTLTLSDLANNTNAISDEFKNLLDILFEIVDNTVDSILPTQTELDITIETVLSAQIESIISDKFANISTTIISSNTLDSLATQISTYLSQEAIDKVDIQIDNVKALALESILTQIGLDTGFLDKTSRDVIAEEMIDDLYTRLSMDEDIQDIPTLTYAIDGEVTTIVYDENGIDITDTLNLSATTVTIDRDGSYTVSNSDFATLNTLYEVKVEFNYVVNDGVENSQAQSVTVDISLADGTASDGHIAGALVFEDINGNKEFDEGETFTYTNENGDFNTNAFSGDYGLVSLGGTDISTGLAFEGILTAPAGSTILSPLTTILEKLMSSDATLSLQEAQTKLKTTLGIDSSIDLTTYDSYGIANDETASQADKTTATDVQKVAVQLATLLSQNSEALDNVTTIVKSSSSSIDLTSSETIKTVLDTSDENIINAVSNINQAISNSTDVESVAKVQVVTDKVISDANSGTVTSIEEISTQANTIIVNKLPVIEVVSTLSANEDEAKSITFSVSDSDGTIATTTATALNGTATINNDGTITYLSKQDYNGVDTITIIATDDDGAVTRKTISVTVNPTNDAPTLSVESSLSVNEDDFLTLAFSLNDIDGDDVSIKSIEATNGIAQIIAGAIEFTPNADFNGTAQINLILNDGTVEITKTISINVKSVNDAPVIDLIGTQTVAEDGTKVITFSTNDIDGDVLNSSISATNGTAIINENGEIEFTPTKDFNGTAQVTLSVNDGSVTTSQIFDVVVTAVNDAPIIDLIGTQTVAEDGTKVITFSASDIDGDVLSSSISATNGTAIINENGEIEFTPTKDFNGTAKITLSVNDGSVTTSQTFDVVVTAVNDLPILNVVTSSSVDEDGSTAISFTTSDIDSSTILASASAINGTVTILNGVINYSPNIDFVGNDTIVLIIDDQNGGIVTQNINISVEALPILSISSETTTEGQSAQFTASLSKVSNVDTIVDIKITDETNDVDTSVQTITIPAGETEVAFNIVSNDDEISEPSKVFNVEAQVVDGNIKNEFATSTMSVVDNDTLSIFIGDAVVNEEDTTAIIKVSLSTSSEEIVSVDYLTSDIVANAGLDYELTSGTLVFEAGVTTQYITVDLIDDMIYDTNESFEIILSNPVNAQIGDKQAVINIKDADITTSISLNSSITDDNTINFEESNSNITITGSVTEFAQEGDSVTISVNGKEFYGWVNSNMQFEISVPGSDLAADNSIDASIVVSDDVTSYTATDSLTYNVDTDSTNAPMVVISEDLNNDGYVSSDEVSAQSILSVLSSEMIEPSSTFYINVDIKVPLNAQLGDTLSVTAPDGTIENYIIDEDILNSDLSLSYAVQEGDEVNVSATITDIAGNVSPSGSDSVIIDTTDTDEPIIEMENSGINGFVAVLITLPQNAQVGDTLTIVNPDETQSDYEITAEMLTNGLEVQVEATHAMDTNISAYITDIAGNESIISNETIFVNNAPITTPIVINEEVDYLSDSYGYLPGAKISQLTNLEIYTDPIYTASYNLSYSYNDNIDYQAISGLQDGLKSVLLEKLGLISEIDGTKTFGESLQVVLADKIAPLQTSLDDLSLKAQTGVITQQEFINSVSSEILAVFDLGITQEELSTYISNNLFALYGAPTAMDKINLVVDYFNLDISDVIADNIPSSLASIVANYEASLVSTDFTTNVYSELYNYINSLIYTDDGQGGFVLDETTQYATMLNTFIQDQQVLEGEISSLLLSLNPTNLDQTQLQSGIQTILDNITNLVYEHVSSSYTYMDTILPDIETFVNEVVNSEIQSNITNQTSSFVSTLADFMNTSYEIIVNEEELNLAINQAFDDNSSAIPTVSIDLYQDWTAEEVANYYYLDGLFGSTLVTQETREEIAQELSQDLILRATLDPDFEDIFGLTYYLDDAVSTELIITDKFGNSTTIENPNIWLNSNGFYEVYSSELSDLDSSYTIQANFNYYIMDQYGAKSESTPITLNIQMKDLYLNTELSVETIDGERTLTLDTNYDTNYSSSSVKLFVAGATADSTMQFGDYVLNAQKAIQPQNEIITEDGFIITTGAVDTSFEAPTLSNNTTFFEIGYEWDEDNYYIDELNFNENQVTANYYTFGSTNFDSENISLSDTDNDGNLEASGAWGTDELEFSNAKAITSINGIDLSSYNLYQVDVTMTTVDVPEIQDATDWWDASWTEVSNLVDLGLRLINLEDYLAVYTQDSSYKLNQDGTIYDVDTNVISGSWEADQTNGYLIVTIDAEYTVVYKQGTNGIEMTEIGIPGITTETMTWYYGEDLETIATITLDAYTAMDGMEYPNYIDNAPAEYYFEIGQDYTWTDEMYQVFNNEITITNLEDEVTIISQLETYDGYNNYEAQTLTSLSGDNSYIGTNADETVTIEDNTILYIDAREGNDTLDLSSEDTNLDLGSILENISIYNIENIDMTSNSEHILSNFTLEEFISLTDEDNTLRILGDEADSIQLDSTQNWTQQFSEDGSTPYTENGFNVYTTTTSQDEVLKLLIEDSVSVENI